MTANLATYRTWVKNWLAASVDVATWTDAMVDEGLRDALVEYTTAASPVEATITVTTGGRAEDVVMITDLSEIAAIGWPWCDSEQKFRPCLWRRAGITGVILENGVPVVGDQLRVRYWRRCTLQGLDNAPTTTVPDVHEHLVVVGAAAHALLLRVRQVAEHPAVPANAAAVLEVVATAWLAQYHDGLARIANGSTIIAWGNIGLYG